ncbi:MAG TPA: FHA domain-containing protein [Candidatus Dormibacteraeota bacterium]|nr:FHA domain-containing protein [Candidatus Dormibacteraeota bacterium]
MDLQQLLREHDRAQQLLLEGEVSAGLEAHVAACSVCGPLATRLAEIEMVIRDVPEPPPDLLRKLLRPRRTSGPPEPLGRLEMLWPPPMQALDPTLLPLALAVDADRYPPEATHTTRADRFIVIGRHPVTIGRGPDLDVPIWDRSASRRHAQLDWREDAWAIRDMESTNGTRVNGARLGTSEVTYLRTGDVIEIGHHARLTVHAILPALEPDGIVRALHRVLARAARAREPRAPEDEPGGDLRTRLDGLREETVRLLSMIEAEERG